MHLLSLTRALEAWDPSVGKLAWRDQHVAMCVCALRGARITYVLTDARSLDIVVESIHRLYFWLSCLFAKHTKRTNSDAMAAFEFRIECVPLPGRKGGGGFDCVGFSPFLEWILCLLVFSFVCIGRRLERVSWYFCV